MSEKQALVLVVDDNEINRDVLSRRITRYGHQVLTAASGREALRMMNDQNFDLVLLDIMMPDMNGYQVLERIKQDPD
ncbi:MAG: response regulator, partial [Anaerolineales bacterium]|nr:response regulator [Anaerolineales bacterium]